MSLKTSLTAASLALGIAIAAAQGTPVAAQSLFSPVVIVNEQVITGYELEQRKRMLQVMRAPGDLNKVAREHLAPKASMEMRRV